MHNDGVDQQDEQCASHRDTDQSLFRRQAGDLSVNVHAEAAGLVNVPNVSRAQL